MISSETLNQLNSNLVEEVSELFGLFFFLIMKLTVHMNLQRFLGYFSMETCSICLHLTDHLDLKIGITLLVRSRFALPTFNHLKMVADHLTLPLVSLERH